jgi:DNA-binding FadR family transcriptional regulator
MAATTWPDKSEDDFAQRRAISRNVKLAEQVARDIAESVFTHELAPGTKLPSERAMLDQFGVSRGTLREALRILEVQGLLIVKVGPAGGPMVAAMTAKDFQRMSSLHYKAAGATVRELWRARVEIEPDLARLAAEARDPIAVAELEAWVDMGKQTKIYNEVEFLRIGGEFHRCIARASCNPILDLIARSLGEMTTYLTSSGVFAEEQRSKVHLDHQAIARAIISGNVQRAEKLMRLHVNEMATSHAERFPGSLDTVVPYII